MMIARGARAMPSPPAGGAALAARGAQLRSSGRAAARVSRGQRAGFARRERRSWIARCSGAPRMMRTLALVAISGAACGGGGSQPACADGGRCASSDDAPRILSLSANTTELEHTPFGADQPLVITAVVTDPDGVDDLIGGQLVAPDSEAAYGAFATSAAEGAYELELTWQAIDAVTSIEAPVAGAPRRFVARFYDVVGHTAEQALTITLRCGVADRAVCDGECVDLLIDPDNCGSCGVAVPLGEQCTNGNPGCSSGPENTTARCSDGCSNDGDQYIDCDDFDCCNVVTCPVGTACHP
jgi:hypothetical protein